MVILYYDTIVALNKDKRNEKERVMAEQIKKRRKWWIIPLVILGVILTLGIGMVMLVQNTILMSFPELKGEPVINSYYDISPKGALTSTGKQWHGIFKKGKENKTVVYFFGGGVSITEETSKRGKEFYAVDMTAQDFVAKGGIGSDANDNPFKD